VYSAEHSERRGKEKIMIADLIVIVMAAVVLTVWMWIKGQDDED